MEIHVFLRNSENTDAINIPRPNQNQNPSQSSNPRPSLQPDSEILSKCTLHYGADWWIEDHADGRAYSYKVISQHQTDTHRFLCVKRMPQNWIGELYLGTDHIINVKRRVFQNIFRVPDGKMDWESFANCV
jgi:hypothetical protein